MGDALDQATFLGHGHRGVFDHDLLTTASRHHLRLLLWLREQNQAGQASHAEPAVDAVRVLTHHASKGLEWPVVILTDLDKEVRNRLWGITTVSRSGVVAINPLNDRFVRYWPWPFGNQSNSIAIRDTIDGSKTTRAFQAAAVAEAQRLLYVSMTRPREMLVLALKDKAKQQALARLPGGALAYR